MDKDLRNTEARQDVTARRYPLNDDPAHYRNPRLGARPFAAGASRLGARVQASY